MKILFTDHCFDLPGGAERAARDLALGLQARGHSVLAYSTPFASTGAEASDIGIERVRSLAGLSSLPDVIHGQHQFDTMAAVTGLRDVPAVFHCHGAGPLDRPPIHPRIYRYITMTGTLAQRIEAEFGLAPSAIDVVPNFVNLESFKKVRQPGSVPHRALIYGNHIRPNDIVTDLVKEATTARGLTLDRIGRRVGKPVEDPENVLPAYDIVFASGKSAIDAIACGCAVIVLGRRGCGEMVREANFERLRSANFTIPVNSPPTTVERIAEEISRFDPGSAATTTRRLRREADLEPVVRRMEGIYRDVIVVHDRATTDVSAERRATMLYLRTLADFTRFLDGTQSAAPWQGVHLATGAAEAMAKASALLE